MICEVLVCYMNLDGLHIIWASIILFIIVLANYLFNGRWFTDKTYKYAKRCMKQYDTSWLYTMYSGDKYKDLDFNNIDYHHMKLLTDSDYDLSNPINARLGRSNELRE